MVWILFASERSEIFRSLFCLGVWGRKDCFPGADGSTIGQNDVPNAETIPIYGADGNFLIEGSTGVRLVPITTSGVLNENTSLPYTLKNPLVYIYGVSTPWDWYSNSPIFQDNQLWDSKKTHYDPCPQGWIVPQTGTWNDFSPTITPYYIQGNQTYEGNFHMSNGIRYHTMVWYPAGGRRQNDSGQLGYNGNYGYCWSSTVKDVNILYLGFNYEAIGFSRENTRAHGFPVRCVQE